MKIMKTFQFRLLPDTKSKEEINKIIFISNQIRNYLIELFLKDENKFLSQYIDKEYQYIPIKGKDKGNLKSTILLSNKNKYNKILIMDKKKLRDILKEKIDKYLIDRKISKKTKIKLSKPIQLMIETFINNYNKIIINNDNLNYSITGNFIEGSFQSDFGLNLIYPKKWNKLSLSNKNHRTRTRNLKGDLIINNFSCKIKLTQYIDINSIKYFILKKDNLNNYFINIITEIEDNNSFYYNDFLFNNGTFLQKKEQLIQKLNLINFIKNINNYFISNTENNNIDNNTKINNTNINNMVNEELYKNSCTIDINYENITIKNNNINQDNQEKYSDNIKINKDNNNINIKDNINKEEVYEIIPLFNKERLKEKYNENKKTLQRKLNEIIYYKSIMEYNIALEYNEEKGSYSWKILTKEQKKQLKLILEKDKKYVKNLKQLKKIDKYITNKQNEYYKIVINKIIKKYNLFIFEYMKIENMKNKIINNNLSNNKQSEKLQMLYMVGLSKLQTMFISKIKLTTGKNYIFIDSFHNSTTCIHCNIINKANRLSQKEFACQNPYCNKFNIIFNADCNATDFIFIKTKFVINNLLFN